MKKLIHIIYSDCGRNIFKTDEWWNYRFKIFQKFTLQSLLNQEQQDFYFFLVLKKPFPERFYPKADQILKSSGLRYIIAYSDKKGDVKKKVDANFPNSKYIYATRIDTDDMFHKSVTKEIQEQEFKSQTALLYLKGYIYDCVNQKMRHYKEKAPPFSTIMYPREIFLDEEEKRKYERYFRGHDTIPSYLNCEVLSENKFIVLVHKKNKRGRPGNVTAYPEKLIPKKEHAQILKDFGVSCETYRTAMAELESEFKIQSH